MVEKVWWYALDDEQKGPISDNELNLLIEHKVLNSESLVWKQGFSKWIKLSEVNNTTNSNLAPVFSAQTYQSSSAKPTMIDDRKTDPFAIITLAAALASWVFLPIIFVPLGWLSAIVSYYRLKENPELKGKGIRLAGAIILIPAMIYLIYLVNH